MAKFSSWYEWRQMARDLTRGLYRLTFRENMLPSELEWTQEEIVWPDASMTWTTSPVNWLWYQKRGKTVDVGFRAVGTVGGTVAAELKFRIPYKPASRGWPFCFYFDDTTVGVTWDVGLAFLSTDKYCSLYKPGITNWTAGAAEVRGSFTYPIE